MKETSLTSIELDNLPNNLNLKPGDRVKITIEGEVQRVSVDFEKAWFRENSVRVTKLKPPSTF